ncbi:MAG: gamma-glutamyl-gamma-aminobutyrate hydrolase family protein [Kiritimatiellae bacterium]|nr:gamma-glutamyl-gamma-aminobutyrate hydrolase family protein [Kiritimatiellia bacterium]
MKRAFVCGLLSLVFIAVGCKIPDTCVGNRPLVVGIAEICRSGENVTCKNTYSHAIYAAGGIPFVLPATTNAEEVARILGKVDALVLCGGEDVAPARYKTAPAPKLEAVNLKRDAWEYALLDEAVKHRLPVVGTCRGLQIINVYFGGTLWQDLPTERKSNVKHRHTGDGKYVTHPIAMEPGSRISSLFDGATNAVVNSRHHQAVKDLAPGFRITARATDGVVEAIESETLPIAAVQFHPEVHFSRYGQREFLAFFRRILDWAGESRRCNEK